MHTKIVDTLVISRLLNPNRDGGHSLEKWDGNLSAKQDKPEFDIATRCLHIAYKILN